MSIRTPRKRSEPGPRDFLSGLKTARDFSLDPLKFLAELVDRYGDLARFRLGPYRAVLVNHPDLIRDVLVTHRTAFPKLARYCRTVSAFSGQSLFVTDGAEWLSQRQLLQPAFHSRHMERYAQATVQQTQRLIHEWSDGSELELTQAMARLALTSITAALFQVDLSDRSEEFLRALRVHSRTLSDEFRAAIVLPDWIPTPAKRRKRWAAQFLRDFVGQLLEDRKSSAADDDDLLSLLVRSMDHSDADKRMNVYEAASQAALMFLAGQDDSVAALSWSFYLLATHPDVESRFRQEVDATLEGRPPTYADLARLPYTAMFLKEVLRLYPPTWSLVPRCAARDVDLGGTRIARGSWVFVSPYATHHDSRFYPRPQTFDPERFSADRQKLIPQYAYLPFGAGPRICMGNHFSTTMLTTAIVTIAQRFRLLLCDNPAQVIPDPSLALRPRGGLRVRLANAD